MTGARLQGTVQSIQANLADRRARVHKQTLGQLVGQFVDDVFADAGERDEPETLIGRRMIRSDHLAIRLS